ncbi:MAG: hypothetical protein GX093_10180 [Xanthomonadaceae bacterium]|nr:hypothetical protein [Xanthomonadaceae bacterium]
MALEKIVSGGQTGVDRGALDAALARGFPCGGWCPAGRLAEDGVIPPQYPLTELSRGGYRQRTLQNVLDSDGTAIIYFGTLEGGTELTLLFCIRHRKPYKLIDGTEIPPVRASVLLRDFVEAMDIRVLNVAGPRASKVAEAEQYAAQAVGALLEAMAP